MIAPYAHVLTLSRRSGGDDTRRSRLIVQDVRSAGTGMRRQLHHDLKAEISVLPIVQVPRTMLTYAVRRVDLRVLLMLDGLLQGAGKQQRRGGGSGDRSRRDRVVVGEHSARRAGRRHGVDGLRSNTRRRLVRVPRVLTVRRLRRSQS